MMEKPERPTESGSTPSSPSKRTLLKAAWVAPVILSITLPSTVMAQGSIAAPPVQPPSPAIN
jgi:hypothetical protein